MRHIAIDLGSRKSQISIREADGTIITERKVDTDKIATYLPRDQPARVILETCAEAFAVADEVKKNGLQPVVVPSTLAPTLGVGRRGVKNDKADANNLSMASCGFAAVGLSMPSVHIPSRESRERKSQLAMRQTMVECRTAMINSVHGWLRAHLIMLPTGEAESFPQRVRLALQKSSIDMPGFVEEQLKAIENQTSSIDNMTAVINAIAKSDTVCQLLMTVPGVGPIVSLAFASGIDEVSRFPTAKTVASYLGLIPGEDSSSKRERKTGITKAGSALLRKLLVQASWCMWRTRPGDPMVTWARAIADRREKYVAITAMARKLSGILYAIMRDGVPFKPHRATASTGSSKTKTKTKAEAA
jgi:transposase